MHQYVSFGGKFGCIDGVAVWTGPWSWESDDWEPDEFDFVHREQCYVRADAFWAWLPLKLEFWLHKHWRWFYMRCIVTLAVWGLADYDRVKHPSWRDIRWPWRH